MSEYEVGDKVVVEISKVEKDNFDSNVLFFNNPEIGIRTDNHLLKGKLEDFQPKQERIKFTPEMKKEFDVLKKSRSTLFGALDDVKYEFTPALYDWLFDTETSALDNKNQELFSKAWYTPSLIESEKHEVKLNNGLYLGEDSKRYYIQGLTGDEFTLDEVEQAEKQLGIQGLQAKWHDAARESERKNERL